MSNDEPGKTALESSAEFVKYTLALGTGALVFSTGLVTKELEFSAVTKWLLIASWVALGISIVAGVITFSAIPVMLKNQNYDLEDAWFAFPGRVHQITFLIGVLCLGATLVVTLLDNNAPSYCKYSPCIP